MTPAIIARLERRLEVLRTWLKGIRDDAPDLETAQRMARVALENDDARAGS